MPKELTLKKKEVDCLKVNIENKSYMIPLGTSLPLKELSKLDNQNEVMKFFEKHLGKEVMESITVDDFKQIVEVWSEATKEASGGKTSLGES